MKFARLCVLNLFISLVLLAACGRGQTEIEPPEIRYGETECAECRMVINDPRFAAAYTYKVKEGRYESVSFDDIGDMLIHADKHPEYEIVAYWVHDYVTEEWIDAQSAFYMFSHHLETPMAQGAAAADSREKAEELAAEHDGEALDWNGLQAKHQAGELVVSLVHETEMGHHNHHSETLITLGQTDVSGYHLTLLSHGALHSGYNHIMLHIVNADDQTVTQADVTFAPLMHMPKMTHAAPVEQPDTRAHSDGLFGGAVGFPMPSGPDDSTESVEVLGHWELSVAFDDPVGGEGQVSFPIEVAPSKLSGSFVASDDNSKLFLMVISPQKAAVGLQPIEILAAQKKSAMEWPPVDDLTLEIIPEMPTMGHGSPNNENPVSIGDGHYQGQVNFTMAGPWTVTVKVSSDGAEIGHVVFEFDID